MHIAAGSGHKEAVELLIAKGAGVNAKTEVGVTPLHSAATKEIAELLIAAGADVNAKAQDDYTPLDFATHPDNPNKNKAELSDAVTFECINSLPFKEIEKAPSCS